MADIEFRNVSKIYDKKVMAAKEVNFICQNKNFFAILGPSGCGKTTTLRMLAGLEDISSGDVYIGGKRVNDLSSKERNVAMSFENYGLYPAFNIYENIAYPLRIRKLSEDQVKKSVYSIAKKLRLTDVLDMKPSALSGGQKQRVSIARALVRNPDVTIMDEPLSHLDSKMRSDMRSIIKNLHQNLGLTTIYVTHDQIEAMTMADKIMIMNEGVVQQIGTPDEVYLEPNNIFVAGFIGSPQMNLINSKIAAEKEGCYANCHDVFKVDVSHYGDKVFHGMDVVYGIRPHDISISKEPYPGCENGIVYVIEALGESTIISIKCGDMILKAEVDGHLTDWNFDDVIYFSIDVKKGHIFDSMSQMRLIPNK